MHRINVKELRVHGKAVTGRYVVDFSLEGDVYLWRETEHGHIVYADACFDCQSERDRWSLRSMVSDLEIIGNRHENPELLQNVNTNDNLPPESNRK